MSCSWSADLSVGPAVAPCRRVFDFTLFFSEIVFQLVPSGAFLVGVAAQLSRLTPSQGPAAIRLPSGLRHCASVVTAAALTALRLASLVLISRESLRTSASIPAAALAFVVATILAGLVHLRHSRGRPPSLLVESYLVLTVLPNAAITRTLWGIYGSGTITAVFLSSLLTQIGLLMLEGLGPRHSGTEDHSHSAEANAGFVSRSWLWWLGPMFVRGYRKPLTHSDLDTLDPSLHTARLTPREFERLATAAGPYSFLFASVVGSGRYAVAPVLPRLCMTGFSFAQPFLASTVITYLNSPSDSEEFGHGLIGATSLVYVGIAISTAWYWNLVYKSVARVRANIVDSVAQKLLLLQYQKDNDTKALTLVIADVQRIVAALTYAHEVWIAPVEVAIGLWLLWVKLGPSCLTVLGVALVSTVASVFVGRHLGQHQGIWLAATQKRLAATKSMLASLKPIKMLGNRDEVSAGIEKLRAIEFTASKMFRGLIVASVISSYSTLTLSPVIAFAAYFYTPRALESSGFDASKMFESLILITLIATPLIRLLQVIPAFGAATGCSLRIQAFLRRTEHESHVERGPTGSRSHSTVTINPEKGTSAATDDTNGGSMEIYQPNSEEVISVQDCDLSWTTEPMLRNINLAIERGRHVVITGPVGCGKTLLLHAILGEVAPLNGTVRVTSSVGYCSQTPWLENAAAADVVFARAEVDPLFRQKILAACDLSDFFDRQLPGSTIGSGGANLSGGERQRLALARAIASRPAVLVIDDALSAIDSVTKSKIADGLFGPGGLLRQAGITVVQTTNDNTILALADVHLAIDESGHLYPSQLPRPPISTPLHDYDEGEMGSEVADTGPTRRRPESKAVSPTNKASAKSVTDKQIYKAYFHSIGSINMLAFLLGGVIFAFCLKFPDIWVKWWADANTSDSQDRTGYWLGLYTLFSLLPLLALSLWAAHLLLRIVPTSGTSLHTRLLQTVLGAHYAFISRIDTGSLLNRFNQDLMFVDSKLPLDLFNTAAALFTCVAQAILVIVASVYLLASLPVLSLTLFAIQHFYLRTSQPLRLLDIEAKAALQTILAVAHEGIVTIRAHGWQPQVHSRFRAALDESQRPFYLLFMAQTWLKLAMHMTVAGLSVLVVGTAVALRNADNASGIGVAILNMATLGESMTNFLSSWTSLETSLGCIARIDAFDRDTPPERQVREAEAVEPPPTWPEKGEIVLENVHATYDPVDAGATEPSWALDDVSVRIAPGERVAVCGRLGSGKSTLLLALLGMIDTPRGSVTIDGVDVSRVRPERLRRAFYTVSQDIFVGGETLRDAIDPSGNVPDKTVEDMLRACGLWGKIGGSMAGLARPLTEVSYSPGETQMLALARTALAAQDSGGIVLLDEATSSIDPATEKEIMRLIAERLQNQTVIAILHRLESAMGYDKILVMEEGRVAHFGTPRAVAETSELFVGSNYLK